MVTRHRKHELGPVIGGNHIIPGICPVPLRIRGLSLPPIRIPIAAPGVYGKVEAF